MQAYEYKVVPAPRRGEKSREAKTTGDRFALALTGFMNTLGRDGWEYLRADTLPCDERSGLTGTKTTQHTLFVFRRPLGEGAATRSEAEVAAPPRLGPATDAPLGAAPAVKLDKP
ncbi:DUF4177 domain-containing protein [Paragemmobacter straminiformis]|uniref:DUF4177 domain-containing protein n=1 Tax=Paragemmobacter straminiformis TaxID=2045119 RepID=A0A842I8M5_9RHOB|nr:DUF4177 domain-containing protein [Gemmobacter straminiformis]MBC2835717.1 DUF4177 domain-containing protein [Gemmobacter straminiformis]